MKLSKYEQETIINFNEEDEFADVYTHNKKLMERLAMLEKEFPEACKFVKRYGYRCKVYRIQKNLISIRKPFSEARKQHYREVALEQGRKPPLRPKNGVITP